MAEEFFIPQLGQTVEEVTLIKWLVEDGAKVAQGDDILEVETDKAVFPVEAIASGYVHIGPYEEGDVVPVLAVVAIIGEKDDKFEVKGEPGREAEGEAVDRLLELVEQSCKGVGMHPELCTSVEAVKKARRR